MCNFHYPPDPTQIVKPLWEPFVALFPGVKPLLMSLNNNCEYYRMEGLRLEQVRKSTAGHKTGETISVSS